MVMQGRLGGRLPVECQFCTKFGKKAMSHLRPRRQTQSFLEFMLIIILITIVALSILLIMGADLRLFVNDLLSSRFPQNLEGG